MKLCRLEVTEVKVGEMKLFPNKPLLSISGTDDGLRQQILFFWYLDSRKHPQSAMSTIPPFYYSHID